MHIVVTKKRQNNEKIPIMKLEEAFFGLFRRVEIDKLAIFELWQPSKQCIKKTNSNINIIYKHCYSAVITFL